MLRRPSALPRCCPSSSRRARSHRQGRTEPARDQRHQGHRKRAAAEQTKCEEEMASEVELGLMFKDKLRISPQGVEWKNQRYPLESITHIRGAACRTRSTASRRARTTRSRSATRPPSRSSAWLRERRRLPPERPAVVMSGFSRTCGLGRSVRLQPDLRRRAGLRPASAGGRSQAATASRPIGPGCCLDSQHRSVDIVVA